MPVYNQFIHTLFLLASFVSIFTGYRYYRYRTPIGKVGGIFLFLLGFELFNYSMVWVSGSTSGVYFWYFLQLICFYLVIPVWLFFVLQLMSAIKISLQIIIFGITCIPASILTILLVLRYMSWEFSIPGSLEIGSVFGLVPVIGPVGVLIIYSFYAIGSLSFLVILRFILTANSEPKLITMPMLLGTLAIILVGGMEHAGFSPFKPVYSVQLGLVVMSFLFFYIVIGLSFGGLVPIGRDSVIEVMHDGIILLDMENRIVDLNPPAEQYLRQNRKAVIKKNISNIWPQTARLIKESPLENVIRGEFNLPYDGYEFTYECMITRFVGLNNTTMGRLVVLRNITEREKMEYTLNNQNQAIARSNVILQELTEANLHIQESNDIPSIYQAINKHLRNLNLECFVTTIDSASSQLRVENISNLPTMIAQIEKLLGFEVIGYRLDQEDFPQLYSYLEGDASDFFSEIIRGDIWFGDQSRKSIIEQALGLIGIDSKTPLMVIHLKAGGKTLGLIGVWGKELRQEDFDPMRIFAGQVAMAIERTILYENEVTRVNELKRSNQLITALAKVSAQMGTSPDSTKALAILGQELEMIGLHCLLGTVNDTGEVITFQYVSFLHKIKNFLGKVPNFHIIGYELPQKLWPENKVVNEGIPVWFQNPVSMFAKIVPIVPETIFKQAMKQIGITPGDSLCILPLIVGCKVTGVLPIWGRGVEEKDTPTLMIFAHQVAEILRKTVDFEAEAARANNLARTNAMIIALSNVAASLETTSDMAEVFKTLGQELRKVDINCMVGTLDENKEAMKIEYLSISQDIFERAKKKGESWPDDVRIPRRFWPTDKAVTEKAPYWDPDPIGSTSKMPPIIPKILFQKAFEMVGMDPNDKVCYLPMISDEDVIGILAVWGPNLREEDVPGLSVFANQVATAIRNSSLYNQAQNEIFIRAQTEARIQAALNEKEVLLREIHHRVKNNLQIISSLLSLQMAQLSDQNAVEGFRESQSRVRAMALIHEKLYQSDDLAQINFAIYVNSLTSSLMQTYRTNPEKLSIHVSADNILLDLDIAIPCGLIINELVTNSLKHAFPDGKTGVIQVTCCQTSAGGYRLVVEDNGVGFPPGFSPSKTSSLGLKLVSNLTRQIEGQTEIDDTHGVRYTINIPKRA